MQWILGKNRPSKVLTLDGGPGAGSSDWVQAFLNQTGLSHDEKRQAYASELLAPYLEPILSQALVSMPQDPHLFVLDWLVSHLEVRIPGEVSKAFYGWMAKESDAKLVQPPGSVPDQPQDFAGVMDCFQSDECCEEQVDALEESPSAVLENTPSYSLSRDLAKPKADLSKGRSRRRSDVGAVDAAMAEKCDKSKRRVSLGVDGHSHDKEAVPSSGSSHKSVGVALEAEAWRRRMRRMSATDRELKDSIMFQEVSPAEIQKSIAGIPLFSKCTAEELQALSEACTLRSCDDAETLLALGQRESDLFVVQRGSCRISVLQEDSMLHFGSCFGEEILFGTNRSSQRQIAAGQAEHVVVACFSRECLERLKLFGRLKTQRLSTAGPQRQTSVGVDEEDGLSDSDSDDDMHEDSREGKGSPRASFR